MSFAAWTSAAWTSVSFPNTNRRFAGYPPERILRWGFSAFAPHIALATGFGPSGVVLMHLVSQIRPQTTVFYLDTDLLFPETLALRDALAERLGITFTRVHSGLSLGAQADRYGEALWQRDPDRCCALRKVEPLRRYLAGHRAWISGLRRDQSASRAHTQPVEWDGANGLVKLNPLAHWTHKDVWQHIHHHDLPYNPLHDEGFESVGCVPCTRALRPGEDVRSGRWSGFAKTECGIHLQEATP